MTGEVYYSTGPHLAQSARNTLTLVKELPPPSAAGEVLDIITGAGGASAVGDYTRALVACGCVVECRICNREVAGSNPSLGFSAPRSTQPSIPPGSVNEYQLRLGRQRQVWLIPTADERVGVQVKL